MAGVLTAAQKAICRQCLYNDIEGGLKLSLRMLCIGLYTEHSQARNFQAFPVIACFHRARGFTICIHRASLLVSKRQARLPVAVLLNSVATERCCTKP